MKAKNYRERLKKQLMQNYNICQMLVERQGVNSGQSSLQYQEYLYVIFNGRIPLNKIAYFRNKKYVNEQPLMRRSFIIQDAIQLNQQIVSKAWRYQRSVEKVKTKSNVENGQKSSEQIPKNQQNQNNGQIQQNKNRVNSEEKVEKPPVPKQKQKQNSKSKRRSITRVKSGQERRKTEQEISGPAANLTKKKKQQQLKQLLAVIQSKLNTARNQEQAAEHQKKYNKYFKELTYLRNLKRIQREKQLLQKIQAQNNSQRPKYLSQLLSQLNQIKSCNAKQLDKLPSFSQKLTKAQELGRVNQIFTHYGRKQMTSNRYFSDFQKQISKLYLETFLKFVHDWHLNRIISIEKIVSLFKIRSRGKKQIDLLQFGELLGDIHAAQCIAEQKPISNESNSQYIQQYIVHDSKMNRMLLNYKEANNAQDNQNKQNVYSNLISSSQTEELKNRSQKNTNISNYKFKPKSHSGKYIHDIKQQLLAKKKTIDFLAGPKNVIKYENKMNSLNGSILYTQGMDSINPSIKIKESIMNMKGVDSMGQSTNSYAFRFKQKNRKSKSIKTEAVSQYGYGQQQQSKHIQDRQNMANGKSKSNNVSMVNTIDFDSEKQRQRAYRQNIRMRDMPKGRYEQDGKIGNFTKNVINEKSQRNNKSKILEIDEEQDKYIEGILGYKSGPNKKEKNKDIQYMELEELVDESEQDQYLRKHMLPPIVNKRAASRRVHY